MFDATEQRLEGVLEAGQVARIKVITKQGPSTIVTAEIECALSASNSMKDELSKEDEQAVRKARKRVVRKVRREVTEVSRHDDGGEGEGSREVMSRDDGEGDGLQTSLHDTGERIHAAVSSTYNQEDAPIGMKSGST